MLSTGENRSKMSCLSSPTCLKSARNIRTATFSFVFSFCQNLKKIYKPIQALAQVVLTPQEIADTQTDEMAQIAVKIRNLREHNSELQRRLETVSVTFCSHSRTPLQTRFLKKRKMICKNAWLTISWHIWRRTFLFAISQTSLVFPWVIWVYCLKTKWTTISKYLSYQRYLKALSLMQENPEIKIKDLASQVGIQNVNTFIRIFKNTAMTSHQSSTWIKFETVNNTFCIQNYISYPLIWYIHKILIKTEKLNMFHKNSDCIQKRHMIV